MAKKRVPKMPAPAIQEPKTEMAVRLVLPIEDYDRLRKQAKRLGLTNASYAKLQVMKGIIVDEREGSK